MFCIWRRKKYVHIYRFSYKITSVYMHTLFIITLHTYFSVSIYFFQWELQCYLSRRKPASIFVATFLMNRWSSLLTTLFHCFNLFRLTVESFPGKVISDIWMLLIQNYLFIICHTVVRTEYSSRANMSTRLLSVYKCTCCRTPASQKKF